MPRNKLGITPDAPQLFGLLIGGVFKSVRELLLVKERFTLPHLGLALDSFPHPLLIAAMYERSQVLARPPVMEPEHVNDTLEP